jgi:hypothetical protein
MSSKSGPAASRRRRPAGSIVAVDPLLALVALLRLEDRVAIGRASRRRSEIGSPVSSQ